MKRTSALLILIVLLLSGCPAAVPGQSGRSPTAQPDHVTLTWTGDPATTMTVTWRANAAVTTGEVEYDKGAALSGNPSHMSATETDFRTNLGKSHLFSATLTGLDPNAKYSYRVGDGKHWSAVHAFSTADPEAHGAKFLVFGDSQSPASSYELWSKTLHNAYKVNPDAKFFVNVGDLVDAGQSGEHWNAWFAAAAGVIDSIPAMPVVGNHETSGSFFTKRPAYWNAQFRLPQNGPERLKNQAYSYDYGLLHVAVLDSQASEERRYGDILTLQKKWLDADLAASKAIWKIVFFHKAPYSIKDARDNKDIRDAFCPAMERHHVDLVFSGHDHGVSRTYPIRNGAYMRRPSQGTIYCIVGRSGTKCYNDLSKKAWNTFFYNPLDQPNYVVVRIDGTKLAVKAVKTDGTVIDTFSIDKSRDRAPR